MPSYYLWDPEHFEMEPMFDGSCKNSYILSGSYSLVGTEHMKVGFIINMVVKKIIL